MASETMLTRNVPIAGTISGRARSRQSIAVTLPAGVAILVTLACATLTATAYLQVRALNLAVVSDRLALASSQIGDALTTSFRTHRQAMLKVATSPAVLDYLRAPAEPAEAGVRAALTSLAPASLANVSVILIDANGRGLVQVGDARTSHRSTVNEPALKLAAGSADAVIGPFEQTETGAPIYVSAVATRDAGRTIGYIIENRRLTGSAQSMALLNHLIGRDAELLVGNAKGDLWTNFVAVIPGPPLAGPPSPRLISYSSASGQPLVARIVPVAGTPWVMGVSTPRDPVLSPALRFLWQAIAITAGVALLAGLAGWMGSRWLTRPLMDVTSAAESIAQARPASRLHLDRGDEIGRLAASFNTMADRVDDGRRRLQGMVDELESRVQARTAALETANRELEAFSYSVSHDLRAPLRAVAGFVTILVEDHGRELSPAAKECVDVIARRAKHMGELIDDLLAFSRLGRQPIKRDAIDMVALAQVSIDEARRMEPAREVEFIVGALPPTDGERSLIHQIFANLVQNAMKFTRTRDHARIEVGCTTTGADVTYFVKDNGVGFDMRYADRLFGVFQRLHRDEDFEGTGVGLAIVQRIIQRHGGRIWAESAVDEGATFFFTLPPGQEAA